MKIGEKRRILLAFLPAIAIFIYIINWNFFPPYHCGGDSGEIVLFLLPFYILFLSSFLLAEGILPRFLPWVMLVTNLFVLFACLSWCCLVTDIPGQLLLMEGLSAYLLPLLTYTSLFFVVLNSTIKSEKRTSLILFLVLGLFFFSIVFMISTMLSESPTSKEIPQELLFISSYFLLILYQTLYFMWGVSRRKNIKLRESGRVEPHEPFIISRNRKEIIYALAIALMIVLGDGVFLCYHGNVRERYSDWGNYPISGKLIYEENGSSNTTALFLISLYKPKKAELEDIHIIVLDGGGKRLNFTYQIIDRNSDGYLNTGDEIKIELSRAEFSDGYGVFLGLSGYVGIISYRFH